MTDRPAASLEVLAIQLQDLAGELARGNLRIGSSLIAVGDPIFLKSKQKLAGGKAYYTLSFQVPVLAEDQEEPRSKPSNLPPPTEREQHRQTPTKMRLGDRPPEGKRIKKEMAALWKNVVRNLTDGRPPTAVEARKLTAFCQEYRLFAEPHWQADWLACGETLSAALDAAKNGDLDEARRLAEEVNQRTKSCHKQYK